MLGLCTLTVGSAVLAGWIWNVDALKTIYTITMKTNTAVGLVLCGASLVLVRRWPRTAALCAVGAGLIGAATLAEHVTGRDLGIDQVLFTEAPGAAATASPNRMGPNGALSLVLAGIALALLARGTRRSVSRAQKIAFAALVPELLVLAGYVYGAQELYGIARYTGIALHTAVTLMILNAGILAARTDVAPMSVCVSRGPAGTLLRTVLLPVAVVPVALGYLEIRGREIELFDRGLGVALFAVSLIVVLTAIVWQTAGAIERTDSRRRRAEDERDRLFGLERQARDEAERASRLKDHFIATLSHELRTPLNVMLGWTRMLETGTHSGDSGHIAAVVARNGRLLARLVEDLLDLSRVTAGQLELTRAPIEFNAVIQSCVESIGPSAGDKGVDVRVDVDRTIDLIHADSERLQQIAWNLLSNAVKFTPPGGRIVVTTRRVDGRRSP